MKNPWLNLPKTTPHILNEDFKVFIKHKVKPSNFGLQLKILPIPFIGNFDKASVVLLCLNPGYHKSWDKKAYEDKYCYKQSIKSLSFSSTTPFVYLDPKLQYTGGNWWWTRLFNPLIKKYGIERLSNKMMCLQYLAYHSETFKRLPFFLPSQNYTFFLLRKAMNKQKIIVIMRSKKLWLEVVPELKNYPYIELKNYRMPYLTERNTKNGDFQRLISALQ